MPQKTQDENNRLKDTQQQQPTPPAFPSPSATAPPDKDKTTPPNPFDQVPPEMQEVDQWVVWRREGREDKTTKVPYRSDAPKRPASTTDPSTWASFNEAVTVAQAGDADGIGYVIDGPPMVFLDFDHCLDLDGNLKPWAKERVDPFVGKTYTEYSPSGDGLHIFVASDKPGTKCKCKNRPGMEPGDTIEIYGSARYSTITGNRYPGSVSTITSLDDELADLYDFCFPESVMPTQKPQPASAGFNGDDRALIDKAMAAANGDKFTRLWNGNTSEYADDDSAADMALSCILAFYCGPDEARIDRLFRQSGLMRGKWDSSRGDSTYGANTIEKAIAECPEFYGSKTSRPHRPDDQSDEEPRITATWSRQGKAQSGPLTVHYNGEPYADHLNLTKSKHRLAALNGVKERWPDIDDSELETLRQRLEELAVKPESKSKDSTVNELEGATIVRPEIIIRPKVSGIAVPVPCLLDGKPSGQWVLHLEQEGKSRSAIPMPDSIPDGEGGKFIINPVPLNPSVSQADAATSWSKDGRESWLAGKAPPDPADLFKRLCEQFKRHIDLPDEHAEGTYALVAIWTVLTHLYPAWPAVPYLYIGGPKGSGKSRMLEVLEQLVFRPMMASNLTGAVLFRLLDKQGGTLLLDEAERLNQAKDPAITEINTILNAGYKHGGQAWRCVGDHHEPTSFAVYGPKAFACINGLSDTLLHRCVTLMMFKEPQGSTKGRRRINSNPKRWQQLRDDLHALVLAHGKVWLDLPTKDDICPPPLLGARIRTLATHHGLGLVARGSGR